MVNSANITLTSRLQPIIPWVYTLNDTIKSMLKHFISDDVPDSGQFKNDTYGALGIPQGTLYYQQSNGVLLVNSSPFNKPGGFIGTWTRAGIGVRVANSKTSLSLNVKQGEVGELIAFTTSSNNRLLLINSDNQYIDIGKPFSTSLISASNISARGIPNIKLQANSITLYEVSDRTISNINFKQQTISTREFANGYLSNTSLVEYSLTKQEFRNVTGNNFANTTLTYNKFYDGTNNGDSLIVSNINAKFSRKTTGTAGEIFTSLGSGQVPDWKPSVALVNITYHRFNTATNFVGPVDMLLDVPYQGVVHDDPVAISRGFETFNIVFTPTTATSIVDLDYILYFGSVQTSYNTLGAVFITDDPDDFSRSGNRLAVALTNKVGPYPFEYYAPVPIVGTHRFIPGTTDPIRIAIRIVQSGPASASGIGDTYVNSTYNQLSFNPTFGANILTSSLKITEYI